MTQPMVGRIVLEDAVGNVVSEMTYTRHPLLRRADLQFQGVWYWQNRQQADGTWVYRDTGSRPAIDPVSDPQLEAIAPPDPPPAPWDVLSAADVASLSREPTDG